MQRDDVLVFGAAALVGWAVARVPGAVIGLVIAGIVRAVRRRRALAVTPIMIEERFADAVGAVAAAVRSGASLTQAIRYASTEAVSPVRDDLALVVEQVDTGIALDRRSAPGRRRGRARTSSSWWARWSSTVAAEAICPPCSIRWSARSGIA